MDAIPPTLENARVCDDYNDENPLPPHPGEGWTRFVCISDTHARKWQLPVGDVLLHSGDLSSGGSFKSLKKTLDWLVTLDHPVKIIIAGNHDMSLDVNWQEGGKYHKLGHSVFPQGEISAARSLIRSEAIRQAGVHYLQHEAYEFMSPSGKVWTVYGSPAAREHSTGAFQYSDDAEAKAIWNEIPGDTEILLTHSPPFGILDTTRGGNQAGCQVLAQAVRGLQSCRLHLFGHIHESHGILLACEPNVDGNRRISVNGAIYRSGQPVVVDLKD